MERNEGNGGQLRWNYCLFDSQNTPVNTYLHAFKIMEHIYSLFSIYLYFSIFYIPLPPFGLDHGD